MRQGTTKLALYGLGNMRDERLGRLFQTPGAVTWCARTQEREPCWPGGDAGNGAGSPVLLWEHGTSRAWE